MGNQQLSKKPDEESGRYEILNDRLAGLDLLGTYRTLLGDCVCANKHDYNEMKADLCPSAVSPLLRRH